MLIATEEVEAPNIEPYNTYTFPSDVDGTKIIVSWMSKQQGVICDLDLNALVYDERARFVERIDSINRISKDESCFLMKDSVEADGKGKNSNETLKLDFRVVQSSVSAILLFIDGGPRNFQYLQSINVTGNRILAERSYGEFLPKEDTNAGSKGPLFNITGRTRKNYRSLILCAFYKGGWNHETEEPIWVTKAFLEPVFVSSEKDKLDQCAQLVISSVPSLEKFRPRLFASIRDLSAALSSHTLPKLKKKFQKSEDGLPIAQFTEVLFKQLHESHPKIKDESEAAYTVAMLQEMFHQIDYNSDGSCSWDEFTSFCVQTGLSALQNKRGVTDNGSNYSLDQYVIEYGEEILQRDHILSAYRLVSLMRYVPENRKILVISEDADNVLILDEKFRIHAQLYPSKLQVIGNIVKPKPTDMSNNNENNNDSKKSNMRTQGHFSRAIIYDIVYLTGRDMYCFTASDHSITVCKELSSMEGMKVNYLQYNRFYHTLLHLKLCWSEKHDLLCSTASDRVIYGWNIDTAQIVFQISRHSDIITDFIAVDHLDVFVTSSMDRRIVMWSATSRRVKGVLQGHKRGVRCISQFENTLLSAGFECDARTWDLVTKDCVAILKGHRHPIVAAKLMCDKAQSEREHRAITVDESGEFRVWNIYVRERASDPVPIPTIQIFEMQNSEIPLNQFRFLALPYNPRSSTSYYSNLIACSTKLLHFLPEKNTKEFVPPTACVVNESSASIITAVGKSILTYDLSTGEFSNIFEAVSVNDIFAICMDGERGKRMYVGTSKGELLLLNTTSGAIISHAHYHTKEISALAQRRDSKNSLFTSSMDGNMRVFEENGGDLNLSNSVDNVFGDGIGIANMKLIPSLHIIMVSSAGKQWGLLHENTLKKLMIVYEEDIVTAIEIIGASRDKFEEEMLAKQQQQHHHASGEFGLPPPMTPITTTVMKENLLTIAVALPQKINIYTLDSHDLKGVKVFELSHTEGGSFYITDMGLLRTPDIHCVNYASMKSTVTNGQGHQLIAVTDDGKIIVWDTDKIRFQSEQKFRQHFKLMAKHRNNRRHQGGVAGMQPGGSRDRSNSVMSVGSDTVTFLTGNHGDDAASVTSGTSSTAVVGVGGGMKASASAAAVAKISKLNRQGTMGKITVWIENTSAELFPLAIQPKDKTLKAAIGMKKTSITSIVSSVMNHAHFPSTKSWIGHLDMIHSVVPLHAHGCFVTVSHDGYHRVWNLDTECLGELQLPNITEVMKNHARCKDLASHWKFILERIPVTKLHIDFANTLVRQLLQSREEKLLESRELRDARTRHVSIPLGFKGFRDFAIDSSEYDNNSLASTEQDRLRKNVLKSLNEPPPNAEDVAPLRLPTKEEKELIKMSIFSNSRMKTLQSSMSTFSLADTNIGGGYAFGASQPLESHTLPSSPATATASASSLFHLTQSNSRINTARSNASNSRSVKGSRGKSNTNSNTSILDGKTAKELAASLSSVGMNGYNTIAHPETATNGTTTNLAASMSRSMPALGPNSTLLFESNASSPSPVAITKRLQKQHQQQMEEIAESTLKESISLNDSKVCLSCFGVNSLWVVPGEKDIFGNSVIKSKNTIPDISVPPAFSDSSIQSLLRDGAIDTEGHRILRKIAANSDRVEVYDRSQPTLLLRNPTMSTTIQLPSLDSLRKTEINFGVQKDMYKHAEKILNEKANVSKQAIRNAVSVARIEQNVNKVHHMIHLIQPPTHDEVILPKAADNSIFNQPDDPLNSKSEENKMRIRLMKSASLVPPEAIVNARPLDNESLNRWSVRLHNALDNQEISFYARKEGQSNKKKKKKEIISQAQVMIIEQKLTAAIRSEFRIYQQQNKANQGGNSSSSSSMFNNSINTPMANHAMATSFTNSNGGNNTGNNGNNNNSGSLRRPSVISSTSDDHNDTNNNTNNNNNNNNNEDDDDDDHDDIVPSAPVAVTSSQQPTTTTTQTTLTTGKLPASPVKLALTTRQLLPYYKLEAVHQFMDIFAKVDENFSGDLDVNEWIKLFSSLNESVTEQEARMIFMKIDKDNNGYLTMRELVPVVFNKATKEQQRMIIQYTEMELTKKLDLDNNPKVTNTDLEFLFEAYDVESVGFVEIAYLRERIRNMRLSEHMLFFFMEMITDLADDEMVNLVEFKRLFKPFTSTQKKKAST